MKTSNPLGQTELPTGLLRNTTILIRNSAFIKNDVYHEVLDDMLNFLKINPEERPKCQEILDIFLRFAYATQQKRVDLLEDQQRTLVSRFTPYKQGPRNHPGSFTNPDGAFAAFTGGRDGSGTTIKKIQNVLSTLPKHQGEGYHVEFDMWKYEKDEDYNRSIHTKKQSYVTAPYMGQHDTTLTGYHKGTTDKHLLSHSELVKAGKRENIYKDDMQAESNEFTHALLRPFGFRIQLTDADEDDKVVYGEVVLNVVPLDFGFGS